MKKLIINGHIYRCDDKIIQNCLNVAKEKFEKEKCTAIYAVEKEGIIEMKKEVFTAADMDLFNSALNKYKAAGFKVYYTKN